MARLKFVRHCHNCKAKFHPWRRSKSNRFCSRRCFDLGRVLTIDERTWSTSVDGYKIMTEAPPHPMLSPGRQLLQHWYVLYESSSDKDKLMELREQGATVHHRNGKRHDNRLRNLTIRLPSEHPKGTSEEDAILLLRALGYTVSK